VAHGSIERRAGGRRLGRAGVHGSVTCVGRAGWLGQLVGPLVLGDGPLVHHPQSRT
jgi:hypothetical protein